MQWKLSIDKGCFDTKCPLGLETNVHDPSNVLEYIIKKCNYKRTTTHKIINVFLRALRKCTRNPSLEFPSSLGKPQKPYIKNYITYDELKKFMNYLKTKEDFQICLIFELLFKLELEQYQKLKLKI